MMRRTTFSETRTGSSPRRSAAQMNRYPRVARKRWKIPLMRSRRAAYLSPADMAES